MLARMRRAEFPVDEELIARLDPDVIILLGRCRVGPAVTEIETPLVRLERAGVGRERFFGAECHRGGRGFFAGHALFVASSIHRCTQKIPARTTGHDDGAGSIVSGCSAMLFVVGTPIGNLDDITLRALDVLKRVDLIAAEDTRHSGHLLRHFEIRKPLVSYHEHNEARRTAELVERLVQGETVALITDAGMPGLSDPGARLIRACLERELPCTIVPGVSAITTALVGSGFDLEHFCYRGFLPNKSGRRERELVGAAERMETTVFFESPHRLTKTLAACAALLPTRQVCVARELTKKFEEFRRGTGGELLVHYEVHPAKGEITLLIAGNDKRAAVSSGPHAADKRASCEPIADA